jgi:hypothetical protein
MGNSCLKNSTRQIVESVQQMQSVEKTLSTLIAKYNKQIKEEKRLARQKIYSKNESIHHVRKYQIIRHHKQKLEKRLESCMNKRYQLEALNVTRMHLSAIKMTSRTFRQFLNENDVEKVEQLQETLTSMIEDACEINESMETDVFEVDEAELEDEYNSICASIQLPEVPTTPIEISNAIEIDFDEHTNLIPLTK